jgi:hypothetical protein
VLQQRRPRHREDQQQRQRFKVRHQAEQQDLQVEPEDHQRPEEAHPRPQQEQEAAAFHDQGEQREEAGKRGRFEDEVAIGKQPGPGREGLLDQDQPPELVRVHPASSAGKQLAACRADVSRRDAPDRSRLREALAEVAPLGAVRLLTGEEPSPRLP